MSPDGKLTWDEIPDMEPATMPGKSVWVLRRHGGPTLTCANYEPFWARPEEVIEGEATYDDYIEAWDACNDLDVVDKVLRT